MYWLRKQSVASKSNPSEHPGLVSYLVPGTVPILHWSSLPLFAMVHAKKLCLQWSREARILKIVSAPCMFWMIVDRNSQHVLCHLGCASREPYDMMVIANVLVDVSFVSTFLCILNISFDILILLFGCWWWWWDGWIVCNCWSAKGISDSSCDTDWLVVVGKGLILVWCSCVVRMRRYV